VGKIVYWVRLAAEVSLGIVPRPRGGDWLAADIVGLRAEGVDVLVSLLVAGEEEELGLAAEAASCRASGIEFVSFPVADLGVPADRSSFLSLVSRLTALVRSGQSVAVHCRQSVGRSGLLMCALVISLGCSLPEAIDLVSGARGVRVPETPEQLRWLERSLKELSDLAG